MTGRDLPRDYNGVMLFNTKGQIISEEVTAGI
jgi:hypothetical protein